MTKPPFTPEEIEALTYHYWVLKETNPQEAWDFYLNRAYLNRSNERAEQSLLEIEMAHAAGKEENLPNQHPNTTLVILVGERLEPLLQSIWVHNPQRLIPMVSEYYPAGTTTDSAAIRRGKAHWENLAEKIKLMLQGQPRGSSWQLTPETIPQPRKKQTQPSFELIKDDPTAIFSFLQNHLQADLRDTGCDVVIDITGAKKTMVAGAFMFAAYSKAKICYIDTERSVNGRPLGYSCRFVNVSNPREALNLQAPTEIEALYNKHDYASTLAVLKTIPMISPKEGKEDRPKLETLLAAYELWEEGDLSEAYKKGQSLPPELQELLPLPISRLNKVWATQDAIQSSFFKDPQNVTIHYHDEMFRIERLQNRSLYRNAFSRAFALYETLLKARFLLLFEQEMLEGTVRWKRGENDWEEIGSLSHVRGTAWYAEGAAICATAERHPIESILARRREPQSGNLLCPDLTNQGYRFKKVRWRDEAQSPQTLNTNLLVSESLKNTRNLMTHTYFPVRNTDVDEIVNLAKDNFCNYRDEWVPWYQHKTKGKSIDWEDLRQAKHYEVQSLEDILKACNIVVLYAKNR